MMDDDGSRVAAYDYADVGVAHPAVARGYEFAFEATAEPERKIGRA